MHLLIVDDNDIFRQMLVYLLQDFLQVKATIVEADSIESAGRLIHEFHDSFDLVLLDHELPDGEGLMLLAEVSSHYPQLTVAMLSSWEDHELMQQALELGASGYIPKSTTTAVIIGAIQLVLAGGTYIPPNLFEHMPKGRYTSSSTAGESHLTRRQLEVLELLRIGYSNKAIARELDISEATVKAHVTMVLRSQGVSSRTQLLDKK